MTPVSVIALRYLSSLFNATATTEIYTLSLHDALPIWDDHDLLRIPDLGVRPELLAEDADRPRPAHVVGHQDVHDVCGPDRKSTRLNSSHGSISYAVFCLKKKKTHTNTPLLTADHPHPN